MSRPAPLLSALVTVGALLAGCGSGAADPASPFPERPADIDVSTVDMCRALTVGEQAELGVEPGEASTRELSNGPTRICGWINYDDGYSYGVQTIADGAVVAVGGADSTVDVLDGYGVVVESTDGTSMPLCTLYVDVSDVEAIRVQVRATKDDASGIPSFDTVCGRARDVASKAIRNLGAAAP
ncbi:uncharacterized protein DUF3558 [Pseudonocardia autotrophica]|uniref:DUF3558 domain-containing protein n=1 Tax=Pseudonocardia autotrophica TaxID=2074 RepID=A0A1Y2MYR1_PSEAH|nr:DUF3558 family protein [Pseudonocardia autotrophica]OSY40356.1 hypothetical protein BG845_02759 [Pseudonocardia autotrophica]TDN72315.1 uncharacterized protein DUF3558 [Pseudonocardia autotrophica]BBG03026.1 hypothetical protein Pdca_42350 [Pseudonocardia autotrophica]